LPGGVKRDHNEIKDDGSFEPKKLNQSNLTKIIKDHKSSIDCLPGLFKNVEQQTKTRPIFACKFINNDIFNINPLQNDFKEIKARKKLRIDNDAQFMGNDSAVKGKRKKLDIIRSFFKSQKNI
jgi:alpha-N-acetylglucosamine transferase